MLKIGNFWERSYSFGTYQSQVIIQHLGKIKLGVDG